MNKFVIHTLAAAVALGASACANPQEVKEMKAQVDTIQAQQKDILAKLEGLEKGQKTILAKGPAAARPARPQEDPNKVYKVNVGKTYGNTKGPKDASVTIVEFSDFQCPFCSQASSLAKDVIAAYPDDVLFVYKNYPLPFHKQAMPAAQAAVAAGKQGKFWEMHDKLFANYRDLNDDVYVTYATEIGLDVEQFKTDMNSEETIALVKADMSDAQAAQVRGTPTFFINGKKPQGRSLDLYKSIIDAQLKEKKANAG